MDFIETTINLTLIPKILYCMLLYNVEREIAKFHVTKKNIRY